MLESILVIVIINLILNFVRYRDSKKTKKVFIQGKDGASQEGVIYAD